jgi:hypothetical protein
MVCLVALTLAAADAAEAQQCRTTVVRGRRVTECKDNDRARERERDRERDKARERAREAVRTRTRVRYAREAVQFGVRGGYDFEQDVGTAGAQLRLPLAPQLTLAPSADVFFQDEGSNWQLNTDLLLRPYALGGVYGGIGVAFLNREDLDRFDSDAETEVGYNLLVGIESGRFAGSTLRPFAEARWTGVDDYNAFRLVAGFNVPISGGRF